MNVKHVGVRTSGPTKQGNIGANPLRRDWRTANPAGVYCPTPRFDTGQWENNCCWSVSVWPFLAGGLGSKVDAQLVNNHSAVGKRWSQSSACTVELGIGLPQLSKRNIVGALANDTRCAGGRLRDQAPHCWTRVGNRSKRKFWGQHAQSTATARQTRRNRGIVKKNHPWRIGVATNQDFVRYRITAASNGGHFGEDRRRRASATACGGLWNLRYRACAGVPCLCGDPFLQRACAAARSRMGQLRDRAGNFLFQNF
mmetsp:Transcript_47338/g.107390  ORF Transcript_47338/g.107390 Transcript_47338/m.107390 type:complete len:255 (+) Transcript_47338:484-1248(+)